MRGAKWAARVLAEKFQPEKIYLFGSRAYGNPHADSDMDLLVVKKTKKPRDMKLRMYSVLGDRDIALDLLVYSPDRFNSQLESGNPFLKTVATKGVLLYDAAA